MAPQKALVFIFVTLLYGCAAAEKGKYTEFVEWCVENNFKYISPPQHTLALIDPKEEETYVNLGLEQKDLDELLKNGGRGIFAANDADAGDVMLVVPFNGTIFMTDDYPPPPWKGADDYARLASLILLEYDKGETSRFWPYLRVVPKHVPLPWVELSPEEYDEMHYEPAKEMAQFFYDESENWFNAADKSVRAFNSFEKWAWANAVLNTRAFWLPVPEKNGEIVSRGMFLPFGDMFNHHEVFHTEWEQRVFSDRVELLTVRALQKGKQVYDHYGKRTSTAFYLEMGWVATSNPNDDIMLFPVAEAAVEWYAKELGLCPNDADDPCFEELERGIAKRMADAKKTQPLLDEEDEDEEDAAEDLSLQSDHTPNPRLSVAIDWLRSEAFRFYADRKDDPAVREIFATWNIDSSELHILTVAVRKIKDLLEGYPTTAEEDEKLLEEDDKSCEKGEDDAEAGQCTWKEPMKPALRQAVEFRLYIKKNMRWVANYLQSEINNGGSEDEDLSDG